MRPGIRFGFLLILCASSGCGTLHNVEFDTCCSGSSPDSFRVYGGVQADIGCAVKTLGEMTSADRPVSVRILYGTLVPTLTLLDLPLSAIADTLTLPLVVWRSIERLEPPNSERSATK
jgi:uncharacterized protein YceK